MRVFVVSAYPAVRAGLAALVREQPGLEVVGEAAPASLTQSLPPPPLATATTARPDMNPPDVVLADLDGTTEGDALVSWLAALRPRGGVVVLATPDLPPPRGSSRQATTRFLAEISSAAIEQGVAFGALLRDASTEEIVAALRAVGGGLLALDRRLAGDLFAASDRLTTPQPERVTVAEEPLTAREVEVLQLLAQGLPNKLIAARLHISEHTAKFHVSAILMKLGAASRTEAVTLAARRGLLIL